MLSIHGKKYHSAVTARSNIILEATSSRTQGATRGVGCIPQIFALAQLIANRWRENRRVIVLAIDLKKAFDCVDHRILRGTLRKKGIHGKLLDAIMSKYSCRRARVKTSETNFSKKQKFS